MKGLERIRRIEVDDNFNKLCKVWNNWEYVESRVD